MGQSEVGFRGIAAFVACAAVLLPTASLAATCGVRADGSIWCAGAVPLVQKGSSDEILTAADALRQQTAQAGMAVNGTTATAQAAPSAQTNDIAAAAPQPPPAEAPWADDHAQAAVVVQPAARPAESETDQSVAKAATETPVVAELAHPAAAPTSAADVPAPTPPVDRASSPRKPLLAKFASMFVRWERRAAAAPSRLASIFGLGRGRTSHAPPLLGQNLNRGPVRAEMQTGELLPTGPVEQTVSQVSDTRKNLTMDRYLGADYRLAALQSAGQSQACPTRLADRHQGSPGQNAMDRSLSSPEPQTLSAASRPPG